MPPSDDDLPPVVSQLVYAAMHLCMLLVAYLNMTSLTAYGPTECPA